MLFLLFGVSCRAFDKYAVVFGHVRENFVKHIGKGRRKVSKEVTAADYRLFVNGDDICLTLRDYNKVFDPISWLDQHHDVKPGEATGIRIVMGLAEKTSYYSAFDSNNLIIWLSMKE